MYVCVLLGDVHKPGVAGRVHRTGAHFQFVLGVHQSTKKFKNCHCNTLNHKSLHLP